MEVQQELTLEQLEKRVGDYALKKEAIRKKKEELELLEKESKFIEEELLSCMAQHGQTRYHSASYGTIFRVDKFSVKVPKTPEERDAFFKYLKERGLFESMITVNSQTLNSWHSEELAQAKLNGEIDFKVPGLNEVTLYSRLGLRK